MRHDLGGHMKNSIFNIGLDPATGGLDSIRINADSYGMNWIDQGKLWGLIQCKNYDGIWGDYEARCRNMELVSFSEKDTEAVSRYTNGILDVTVERTFTPSGNFRERYTLKNTGQSDLFLGQDSFGITVPFSDRYTDAQDCMVNRCSTHLWCGHHTTYINAVKMGCSDTNLGLVLLRGAIDSYSVLNKKEDGYRGVFLMNLAHTELLPGEEYVLEWELFVCADGSAFYDRLREYDSFIDIWAKHFTVFLNEKVEPEIRLPKAAKLISARIEDTELKLSADGDIFRTAYQPKRTGKHRLWVETDRGETFADFNVVPSMDELVEKRLSFIVDKQQYRRIESALDGAFLIYDNEEKHPVFDDTIPDHNACRERIGMALLLISYLQEKDNVKWKKALDRYMKFVYREFFDEKTGRVYDTIGKSEAHARLYNAPWVSMLLTEMYWLTKDAKYLQDTFVLLEYYYENGGKKFYPNGFSFLKTHTAFVDAGLDAQAGRVLELFKEHAENIIANGTAYPKHEVNYEQTIVSPAVTFLSEMGIITGEERYCEEAGRHVRILERFNGHQPSFYLHEIPIRYWDDYWFGKRRMSGDTFPHYWSCLTARAYLDYCRISGEEKYRTAAEECMRNCLCLFADDGSASCAYVYPHRINGLKGEFYDEWANDQDFALYFALETGLCPM